MNPATTHRGTTLLPNVAARATRTSTSVVISLAIGAGAGALSAVSTKGALAAGSLCLAAALLWILRAHFLVVLMVALWYLPSQTGPGGLLESAVFFRWAGVLLIPLVAGGLLLQALSSRRGIVLTQLVLPMGAVLAAVLLSALANRSSLAGTVGVALLYLRYPLFFIALVNLPISLRTTHEVVKVFLVLVIIQIPEVLIRYAVTGVSGDRISWTLGPYGTLSLGVYCIYAMCLVAGVMVTRGVTLPRIAALCALLIPSLLGEIKALLLFGPICVMAVLAIPSSRLIALPRRLTIVALLLVSAVSIYGYWTNVNQGSNNVLGRVVTQVEQLIGQSRDVAGVGRVDRLSWTLESGSTLAQEGSLAFGGGPGSGLAGGVAGTASSGATQLSSMLWDMGAAGLVSYFWLLLSALAIIAAAVVRIRGSRMRGYACAMVGMWVFYTLLGPNYDQVWRYDAASFLFWVLLAGLYVATRATSARPEDGD